MNSSKILDLSSAADCREYLSQVRLPDGSKIHWIQYEDGTKVRLEFASDSSVINLANDFARAAAQGETIQ